MAEPPEGVTVKLVVVMVLVSIASENVALTLLFIATPVAVSAGLLKVTVGAVVSTV